MTIDALYEALAQARKAGLGGKKIMLSNDDEGNGYHEMYYAVTPGSADLFYSASLLPWGVNTDEAINDYVVLG